MIRFMVSVPFFILAVVVNSIVLYDFTVFVLQNKARNLIFVRS